MREARGEGEENYVTREFKRPVTSRPPPPPPSFPRQQPASTVECNPRKSTSLPVSLFRSAQNRSYKQMPRVLQKNYLNKKTEDKITQGFYNQKRLLVLTIYSAFKSLSRLTTDVGREMCNQNSDVTTHICKIFVTKLNENSHISKSEHKKYDRHKLSKNLGVEFHKKALVVLAGNWR